MAAASDTPADDAPADDADDNPAGDEGKPRRRRGADLEHAILDAAWEQLVDEGHRHFTIDTVAARAQTSKPVLYRRWRTREDLLRATIRQRGAKDPIEVPDTGSLRTDLLTYLGEANRRRTGAIALFSSMVGSYYDDEQALTPAEWREEFIGGRRTGLETILERAVERGEVDPGRLAPRVMTLPFDLFRHEVMTTLRPVPDHVIRQIVDDVFLPLVMPTGG